MRNVSLSGRATVFALVVGALVALDLGSKSWIFNRLGCAQIGLPGPGQEWLIRDVFAFTTSLNEGALFGVGKGYSHGFAALSVVAAVFIAYWLFGRGGARDWLLTISLAFIMAGTLGNLYDRLGLHGLRDVAGQPVHAVRDFLYFAPIDWPVFNVADSSLMTGAGLLLLHAFLADRRTEATTAQAESRAGEKVDHAEANQA